MSYKGWVTQGVVNSTHDDSVHLKRHATFDPFMWGGKCMALDDGAEALGGLTPTTRRSTYGGLERDGVLIGAPGLATTTLTMKKLHYDRKKTDLKFCLWDVDQRTTCGGEGADAWNKWTEIKRYCYGKANERGTPKTTYEGDGEEQVVTFAWESLYVDDIRRVVGEIGEPLAGMTAPLAIMFTDVAMVQPARCPDICDNQEECIVVGVTETVALGTSHLAVSLHGGALDTWTDPPLPLTAFGVFDASAVTGVGEFVCVVCNGGTVEVIYSDDLGTTQIGVTTVDLAANGPNDVDMINQAFIVAVGDGGYVYGSYDAARNWETLDAGDVTASNLTSVMIARDNPQVIYAASSAADVVIKSTNGGRTWYACATTGTAGTGPTSLLVLDQNHIQVGTDAGELFESSDGADSWTEQTELPGLTTKANTTIVDIVTCGCGDLGLVISDTAGDLNLFYRNVDGGADGRWFLPDVMETMTATYDFKALTCCGSSHFVAVGGKTVTGDAVMLLE